MVTGRKGAKKPEAPNAVIGLFHELAEELTDRTKACDCYSDRFQQEIAQTRGEVRAEGKASKGEEAEGSKERVHKCLIPSPAI
jgi:hypothetical protein